VAVIIGAVDVAVRLCSAVHTLGDDDILFLIDFHGYPVVEDIALSIPELSSGFLVLTVGHNSAFKVIDILESLIQEYTGQFFTPDASGAVGDDLLVTWEIP